MRFASLGSGSEGNALLVSAASGATSTSRPMGTTVMLDCGFAIRETERRLARLSVIPTDLAGIVVTHEHQDHIGGVFKFARRHRIPVWLSHGTWQAVRADANDVDVRFCRDGERLAIGDLEFLPYTVPHDAREPLQYCVSDGQRKLGVLTDAGQGTSRMMQALDGCDALVLECNHDRQMLVDSSYPSSLKQRIGGAFGHLSNETASAILAAMDQSKLGKVIGAHLSQKNNTPEHARAALLAGLHSSDTEVAIACQEEGFGWIALSPI